MNIDDIKKSFSPILKESHRVIEDVNKLVLSSSSERMHHFIEEISNKCNVFYNDFLKLGSMNLKSKFNYDFRLFMNDLKLFHDDFKVFLFDELDDFSSRAYNDGVGKLNEIIEKLYIKVVSDGSLMFLCAKDFIDSFDGDFPIIENKEFLDEISNFVNNHFSQKDTALDAGYVVELRGLIIKFLKLEGLGDNYNIDGNGFGSGTGTLNNVFISLMRLRFECDEYIRINNIENSAQQDHWISQSPEFIAERIKELYEKFQNADSSASEIIKSFENRLEESSQRFSKIEKDLEEKVHDLTVKFNSYKDTLENLVKRLAPNKSKLAADLTKKSYDARRKSERISAEVLRVLAFLSLSAGVGFALYEIWCGNIFSANWKELLARLTITSSWLVFLPIVPESRANTVQCNMYTDDLIQTSLHLSLLSLLWVKKIRLN